MNTYKEELTIQLIEKLREQHIKYNESLSIEEYEKHGEESFNFFLSRYMDDENEKEEV